MSENDADEPRFFSKQWWTQRGPYWGEWARPGQRRDVARLRRMRRWSAQE